VVPQLRALNSPGLVSLKVQSDDAATVQEYQECKAHTSDLEWCFKQFQPKL